MGETTQPPESAPKLLTRLMAEKGFSKRSLSEATKAVHPRGLSHGAIGNIARGKDSPSVEALEILAAALGVPPGAFAEYQLAVARRLLDERQVGLEDALQVLAEISSSRTIAAALDEAGRPGEAQAGETGRLEVPPLPDVLRSGRARRAS